MILLTFPKLFIPLNQLFSSLGRLPRGKIVGLSDDEFLNNDFLVTTQL